MKQKVKCGAYAQTIITQVQSYGQAEKKDFEGCPIAGFAIQE